MICFLIHSSTKAKVNDGTLRKPRHQKLANILLVHVVLGCNTMSGTHGIGKGFALRKIMKDLEFWEQPEVLIMKITQTVILLQLERKSWFVYTTAGLTKVWIRYDIGNSARRSQQGLRSYSPNVSL